MLGIEHPRELFARLTAKEWIDWVAYYTLSPFGETRADERQASLLLNMAAPWMPESHRAPALLYPYFTDDESEIDNAETVLAIDNLRALCYGEKRSESEHSDWGHDSYAPQGS